MLDSIDYYNQHAAEYYDKTVEINLQEILDKFIELLPEGAAVLDLGCGSGRDSLYFIEEGFDVTAVDGAEELCELASIHIGQDVLNLRFSEIDFEEVFDGVWACASLLHVTSEEIDCVLDKVIDSLNPDGILYMSFKYGDFRGVKEGRYYQYYTTRTLKELIGKHEKLEIIDIFKTDDIRTDREGEKWINIFARKIDKNNQE